MLIIKKNIQEFPNVTFKLKTKSEMKSYKHSQPPLSPLAERICKCGCDIEFQPNRKDQVFLNKQHADFGYNHNIRRKKDANKREQSKILAKNDRILEKHFKAKHGLVENAETYLEILRADGYNFSMHVGAGSTLRRVWRVFFV